MGYMKCNLPEDTVWCNGKGYFGTLTPWRRTGSTAPWSLGYGEQKQNPLRHWRWGCPISQRGERLSLPLLLLLLHQLSKIPERRRREVTVLNHWRYSQWDLGAHNKIWMTLIFLKGKSNLRCGWTLKTLLMILIKSSKEWTIQNTATSAHPLDVYVPKLDQKI